MLWSSIAVISAVLTGCAATGSGARSMNPLAMFRKPDAAKVAEAGAPKTAEKPAAEEKVAEAKKGNPFKKAGTKPAVTEVADQPPAKADAKPATETKPAPEAVAETKPADTPKPEAAATAQASETAPAADVKPAETKPGSNPAWKPETLALIESELRGAPPDEKDYWYGQLKRVDPAVIPDILRARRLSIELAERMKPKEGEAGVQTVSASIDPAAPLVATTTPTTPAAQAGLGAVNPWGTAPSVGTPANAPGVSAANNTMPNGDQAMAQAAMQVLAGAGHPGAAAAIGPYSDPNDAALLRAAHGSTGTADNLGPFAVRRIPYPEEVPGGNVVTADGAGAASNGVQTTAASQTHLPPELNSPVSTAVATPMPWQSDLDRLIGIVEQDVARVAVPTTAEGRHAQLRQQLYLRMLYLMANRPERALTAIPGLDPVDQEFCQQVLWGLANYLDVEHMPRSADRAGQAISQLNTAVRRLREVADLEIRSVGFCQRILDFGIYERFPRDEFSPGQEVLVYAEIDNYRSDPTLDGRYRTVLRSTLEILSPTGEVRWKRDFPATEDLCRAPRRDYFHNYQFAIPDKLPLGPHRLKLTIFDELSGKMSSYTANFVVK
ncbi:MAG: hypothetical protein KF777_16570 [Planctomycetaceae bacterium]|nr:hypothetical protein [Planctomycetaceae bacterium]